MTTTLYGLHYSPWTERARWALDVSRVAYRYAEHLPLLGEAQLRWRSRGTGIARASVPLLVHDGQPTAGSLAIMRWADARSSGPGLGAAHPEVERLTECLEPALRAMRARVTAAVLVDPEALRESVMVVAPAALAGAMRPVAAMGARFIAGKHGVALDREAEQLALLAEACDEIARLRGDREYLQGDALSALDLVAATFLQGIRPVDHPIIPHGPALRRAWTRPDLAERFAHLLAWRDELYRRHR